MFRTTLQNILIIFSCTLVAMSQVTGVVVARSGVVVKNAPYSADVTSTLVQNLIDGNKVITKFVSKVYRDSEGRVRTEQVLSESELKNPYSQQRETITIEDPVAGYNYYLNPNTKTARRLELKPYQQPAGSGVPPSPNPYKFANSTLPEQTIEGLVCRGTLNTTTIAAGAFGNERKIVTTMESWYSSELKITVLSKSSDPRMGDRTYETKDISRSEPDKSLFIVPKDYTIIEVATVKE